MHAVAPPADLGPADWGTFVDAQTTSAVERQRRKGLGDESLVRIPDLLASVDLPRTADTLRHTEFMHVHVLTTELDSRWDPTGLFDCEPAMRGHTEYDLVAAGIFFGRDDKALWSQLLAGYGVEPSKELSRRLMAYALLHVYANLPWYFREIPSDATTFDELADD
ncbi:phosphotransferase [Stackebrandtia soli]|uniref:phosphotransferase n=1 Tax=Stackebrandtia soli TaxID=1892856 RepID=UPI0039E8DA12